MSSIADGFDFVAQYKLAPPTGRRSRLRSIIASALAVILVIGFASLGDRAEVAEKLREHKDAALGYVGIDDGGAKVAEQWREWWAANGDGEEVDNIAAETQM